MSADAAAPALVQDYFSRIQMPRGFLQDAVLTDISDQESIWRPRLDIPPISWHVAHIAVSEAIPTLGMSAGRWDVLPDSWLETFAFGCELSDRFDSIPVLSEVLPEAKRLQAEVRNFLEACPPEEFDKPLPHRRDDLIIESLRTLSDILTVLPIHESHHGGEIALLRRLQGKPRIM